MIVVMVEISVYLLVAMQQPLLALAKGYVRHTGGRVEASRLLAFLAKLEARYPIGASYTQRQSRRRRGLANYALFVHPRRDTTKLDWWLLATDGIDDIESADRPEKWQDPAKAGQRLNFQDRFEASQMPAKGGINRWTWRITAEHFVALSVRIHVAIGRRDDAALRSVITDMHKMPGFRGVRGQVTALRKLVTTEWKQAYGKACPLLPPRVQGYQRYRSNKTIAPALVVDRIRRGQVPIAFAWRKNDPTPETDATA